MSERRIGVLLVNLGTPEAPTPAAVRRYLAEFLSDRRVVEIPPLVWQPILRGIILQTRPKKSAEAYKLVWQEDSPLRAITRAQAEALDLGGVKVAWAMRYGNPSIAAGLDELGDCDRILIAPLYPQYCAATTASVMDKVFEVVGARRAQPALRTLPPYFDEPVYIDALAESASAALAALDFAPQLIVASFHGMPARTVTLGDPYRAVGEDIDGTAAIAWGITGAPETFVVDSAGIIRYHLAGPMLDGEAANEILPLLRTLK